MVIDNSKHPSSIWNRNKLYTCAGKETRKSTVISVGPIMIPKNGSFIASVSHGILGNLRKETVFPVFINQCLADVMAHSAC